MTTMSKTKSRFNQVLLKIDARRFRENNQQKCIDCLKPRSNKNELECKNVVAINFMCPVVKVFHLQYCPFCNV